MATTETTTQKTPVTYAMLVVFTVDARSDQHLQDQQAIRAEAQSWLESLNAGVKGVCLRTAD